MYLRVIDHRALRLHHQMCLVEIIKCSVFFAARNKYAFKSDLGFQVFWLRHIFKKNILNNVVRRFLGSGQMPQETEHIRLKFLKQISECAGITFLYFCNEL